MTKPDRIRLSFAQADCRCGAARIAAIQCPDCGYVPKRHEINPAVQRRRRFKSRIDELMGDPEVNDFQQNQPFLTVEPVLNVLGGWTSEFCRLLNMDHPSAPEVVAHIEELIRMRKMLDSVRRLRPWRALLNSLDMTAKYIFLAHEQTIEAYIAPTPLIAQNRQNAMQRYLDQAGEFSNLLATSLSELDALNETKLDQQVLLVATSQMSDAGGTDAAQRLIDKLPSSVLVPPGTLEFIGSCARMTQMLGEEEEFVDIASKAIELLTSNPAKATEGFLSEKFRSEFKLSMIESYSSAATFEIVMSAARNEQVVLDGMLEIAHALVESASRPHVAILASCLVDYGYRAVITKGANKAIKTLEEAGHGQISKGLCVKLRNAKAHRSYRLSGDRMLIEILKDNGNLDLAMNGPELADSIIAAQVNTLALLVGCYLGAMALGADPASLFSGVDAYPLEMSLQVAYVILGWPAPEVEIGEDGQTLIVCNCPPISANMLSSSNFANLLTALAIYPALPPRIKFLVFDDGMLSPIEVRTSTAHKIRDVTSSNIDKVAALCEVRRGGLRALDINDLRKLLVGLASLVVDLEPALAIRELRKIREIASSEQEAELVDATNTVISSVRNKALSGIESYTLNLRAAFLGLPE